MATGSVILSFCRGSVGFRAVARPRVGSVFPFELASPDAHDAALLSRADQLRKQTNPHSGTKPARARMRHSRRTKPTYRTYPCSTEQAVWGVQKIVEERNS